MNVLRFHSRRALITLFVVVSAVFAGGAVGRQASKPRLQVLTDGFPSGHDTPEGAASDVMRALINRDETLFTSTCISPYGGGNARVAYEAFLRDTVQNMKQEKAKKVPSPRGPKAIEKVFAARHLNKNGPASYGYAAFGFEDVMFVDIYLSLQDGKRSMMRNMVIKNNDGRWYVHPDPSVSPLLSEGLDDESESNLDFTDAYEIERRN